MQSPFLKKQGRQQLGAPKGVNPGDFITLFAYASYCDQTKAFGYGWWIKYGAPPTTKTGSGGGTLCVSSLEAEIAALQAGLQYILDHVPYAGKMIVVQSDCTGAIDRIEVGSHFTLLRHGGAKRVYCKHVHGHRGHVSPRHSVNTTCDQLARRRMKFHRAQVRAAMEAQAFQDVTT